MGVIAAMAQKKAALLTQRALEACHQWAGC